jgi:rSAM/selenodomain-associated transferase 2
VRRVSVIVPVLDEARALGPCLGALAALALGEVIVVDGGSGDGTAALAAAAGVRVLSAPRGRASQMNAGARVAAGEVLLFLHADVSLPADARVHVERALDDSRVVAGAFRTLTVADRPTRLGPLLRLADLRSRRGAPPYGDQALFVRTEVFWRLGGFPPLPLMEDLAFSLRLAEAGQVRIVPASVRVSGRRFIERPVSSLLAMNLFPALYRLGVPASLLARGYRAVR